MKVSEAGAFVITGYIEGEAVTVTELRDAVLVAAGLVKFGRAGKYLWERLEGCVWPGDFAQPAEVGSRRIGAGWRHQQI